MLLQSKSGGRVRSPSPDSPKLLPAMAPRSVVPETDVGTEKMSLVPEDVPVAGVNVLALAPLMLPPKLVALPSTCGEVVVSPFALVEAGVSLGGGGGQGFAHTKPMPNDFFNRT